MKKLLLLIISFIIIFGMNFFQYRVSAAATNPVNSNANIRFIPKAKITQPLDPTSPDNLDISLPIDPNDPLNEGTGNYGMLTIDYVSTIMFGDQELSPTTTTYYAINENPFIQVTDNRGTGEGWTLKASVSEFISEDGQVLEGAVLSIVNGQIKSQSDNISAPPSAKDVVFDNTSAKIIMFAKEGTGRGTWLNVFSGIKGKNLNIKLEVDLERVVTNYMATVTWELSNAPN